MTEILRHINENSKFRKLVTFEIILKVIYLVINL